MDILPVASGLKANKLDKELVTILTNQYTLVSSKTANVMEKALLRLQMETHTVANGLMVKEQDMVGRISANSLYHSEI